MAFRNRSFMSPGSALLQAERRRVRSLYDHLRNVRLGDRVRLDVKHYSAALENARLRVCILHVLWRLPLRLFDNGSPGIVLTARCLDSPVTGVRAGKLGQRPGI